MKRFLDLLFDRAGRNGVVAVLAVIVIVNVALGFYWSMEPAAIDPQRAALARVGGDKSRLVTGTATVATLAAVAQTLLDKPGGYLSNDVMPPSLFMDNMKNWEFGVLVQVRDLAKSLRDDMSRSQTQSVEDPDLIIAQPLFNYDNAHWIMLSSESQYRKAIAALDRYLMRLSDPQRPEAQFYARADNLRDWLSVIEKRLGNLSQRLSASVGQTRVNADLGGQPGAAQSTERPTDIEVKTPWLQIDDEFYEARGACWALIAFLRAAEIDFAGVLERKNALVSLRQIIRELEGTQQRMWSPMVLNGTGFGFLANHSLVMASYISRANAAMIDLRRLLEQG